MTTAHTRKPKWIKRTLIGTAVAAIAAGGIAATANADDLGTITNYAPGYVFNSPTPDRNEVESTVMDGALAACRNDYPAATSASLISYTQEGPGGPVTSQWNCGT
ncbi:hypothetical protein ACI2L1_36345 [Streptomyces sp. NPDC019531]|uniref:hypothetical protein n=1 Tax=Streptomyces sp. NPDC019531 TaxID=3365062 RepID=UPI0038501E69